MMDRRIRVDNAIIICSNIDSYFESISKKTPMALVEVKGERLVERNIEKLKESGIDDICVVVGDGLEDFRYLIDKYDVDLIEMADDFRGSLFFLDRVRDRLANTYILNGRDYIGENLYSQYESRSWHSIIETTKYTEEKAATMDRDGRIVDLKDGGYRVEFLYGPAFLTRDLSEQLKIYLDDYRDDITYDGSSWQDMLLENIDELEIYGNKRPYESIYTFASMDELQRLDMDIVEDRERLVYIISNIMEVSPDEIYDVVHLGKGMTNDSMVFIYDEEEYIIRVPGMGTDKLIDRENEYLSYQAIEDLDISDRIVFMNNKNGIKISKFEKNSRTLDMDNEGELERAFDILRKLHNSGIGVEDEFDLENRLDFYEDLCLEQGVEFLEGYQKMKDNTRRMLDILSGMDIANVFCHIDPVGENYLVLEDGDMILIDWEYSSMADPLIDLAMFSIHEGLGPGDVDRVMEIYLEGEPDREEKLRVYIYISVCSLLWYLWAEYKGALGDGFEDYKMRVYSLSKKYAREVFALGMD